MIASAARGPIRITPRPCRAIATTRRKAPSPSTLPCWSFALANANANSPTPAATKTISDVVAQAGIFAVIRT